MADFERQMLKKPSWLRKAVKNNDQIHMLKKQLRKKSLNTVCESAKCPNLFECFNKKQATFMILGDICTRNCQFCAVSHGIPKNLYKNEPMHIVEIAKELRLRHIVITSVTRDDLQDQGSEHYYNTILAIKKELPKSSVEILTPDFKENFLLIDHVLKAKPDVFNHNIETVERLTPIIRDKKASYKRSLKVLDYVKKNHNVLLKSGIMVGLGEKDREVCDSIRHLSEVGCDIITIGQYLMPSLANIPVKRYVDPSQFESYRDFGESIGIKKVFAGPFVRSSYMAEEVMLA